MLAAVGLYGAVSYAVGQRTRELGIRMALGARPPRNLLLVVADGLKPVLIGAALGVAGALAASEVLAGLLCGVRPLDAATYLQVTLLLAATALLACAIPAHRAARLDPLAALRRE